MLILVETSTFVLLAVILAYTGTSPFFFTCDRYALITSFISDIHASGPQNQIENAARQELYEEAKEMLDKLMRESYRFALKVKYVK